MELRPRRSEGFSLLLYHAHVFSFKEKARRRRMIEQFLGEEVFRTGVGDYLRRHAYANTVTADLWHALDEASGRNVGEIMDTWILQEGHPRVAISVEGPTVTLTQSRYLALPNGADDRSWKVPLQLRGTINGKPFQIRHLLESSVDRITLDHTRRVPLE